MLKTIMIRSAMLVFAWSMSVAAYAYASDLKLVDVPAGDLSAALQAFAKQSGIELVYQSKHLEGLRTKGIKGSFSAEEAVTKLLEGTSLTFRKDPTGALLVAPPRASPLSSGESRDGEGGEGARGSPGVDSPPGPGEEGARDSGKVRLAQSEGEKDKPSSYESQELPALEERGKAIPEILVEGSKTLNMDIARSRDDAQPYVVFDRSAIEKSGLPNVEEFLKHRLPMNSQGATQSQLATNGNFSSINLRGLGTNQTLILIDGRRAPNVSRGGSPSQPDINGIPLVAIERIEVLPATASGIYGGSATGGVVNIILRRDYQGVELGLTYDNTVDSDSSRRRVDIAGGLSLEGGKSSLTFAGAYSDANSLSLGDRELAQQGRATIFDNNPAFFLPPNAPPLGATPNIRSTNNTTLVLDNGTSLNSPFTSVPVGYAGPSSDGGAALAGNAGRYNFDLPSTAQGGGSGSGFTNNPTVKSLAATVRRHFSERIEAFVDVGGFENIGHFYTSALPTTFVLLPNAQNNPFQQQIQVQLPDSFGDAEFNSQSDGIRAVGGLMADLGRDWRAELDLTWGRSTFRSFGTPQLSAAGTSAITTGGLPVLRDTSAFPLDLSPYMLEGQVSGPHRTTTKTGTFRVAGPLLSLPAGDVIASALVERHDETFDESRIVGPGVALLFPERSQSIRSIYLETRVPLFSEMNKVLGVQELDLQISGRRDNYVIDGATSNINLITAPNTPIVSVRSDLHSTNPTIGLRWKPSAGVALRASYGTGFLPPAVNQLLPNPAIGPSSTLIDPQRGNGQFVLAANQYFSSGGNPGLQPEESESWSGGVIITPSFIPNLRLSVDYTQIEKIDNIASHPQGLQGLINDEAFLADRVTRGPNLPTDQPGWAGPVIFLDNTAMNIASADVEAYDVQADYELETSVGTFSFYAVATWQTHYRTQTVASQPVVENVGVGPGNPLKFKGNGSITWERGAWLASWATGYFDSYLVANPSIPTNVPVVTNQGREGLVSSQVVHDAFVRYRFDDVARATWLGDFLSSAEIQLGVANVFNKEPSYDASTPNAFYSRYTDPRLRSYSLSVRVRL